MRDGSKGKENSVNRKLVKLAAMVLSTIGLMLGSAHAAHAGEATDVVRDRQGTLFSLLKQHGDNAKIRAVFDELLDYDAFAQASLGDEWSARSDDEKSEFSNLLKQLVRKAYEKNLKKTISFTIDYLGEDAADGGVIVKTRATNGSNAREEPVEIDFKMGRMADGTWKVRDIVTEGAPLVRNYRSQFTKIIKRDGFPALIKKMREKLAKGDV